MCGIFGLIEHGRTAEEMNSVLTVALRSMIHRGPDGEGRWVSLPVAMGMRRLAIMDVENGNQPFFSKGERVVVFQNGEIYNFPSLKNELKGAGYQFISDCDTEVLAHGYAHWGMEGLLKRLDGMFAIAVLDEDRKRLLFARDRYGEKPFYYAVGDRKFAYSSTLVSIAALPWVSDEHNATSLHRYLCLGFVPGDETIFRDIKKLPPGCWMEVSIDTCSCRVHRYHFFDTSSSFEGWSENRLREEIDAAVRSRLLADVPVGLFLSGGIDSSLLVYFATKAHPGIRTFSVGFNQSAYDESVHARTIAREFGATHHHFTFGEEDFHSMFTKVANSLDEPIGDQACLPLHLLSVQARKYVTVVLSGEGADEIFGGYFYYSQWCDGRGGRNAHIMDHKKSITASGFPFMVESNRAASWVHGEVEAVTPYDGYIESVLDSASDELRGAKLCDINTWLPDDLLVKLDRMTMAASLEGRVPYLSPVLEKWLYLRPEDSIRPSAPKYPLRLLAKKYLPRETWDRPKQGFVLPLERWIQAWLASHGGGKYCINNPIEGLDNEAIAEWIDVCLRASSGGWGRSVFSVIMLYAWSISFKAKVKTLSQQMG